MKGVTFRVKWGAIKEMFQSTLPMKGVTPYNRQENHEHNVSIHTPNEGSDQKRISRRHSIKVSIHTPNEGSDKHVGQSQRLEKSFNPHSQ